MSTVDSVYLVWYFLDISMPLFESMLLSSFLTPVEIGPSNAIYIYIYIYDHYLQIKGTAMGTKMAPAYANIFMDAIETSIFSSSPLKPSI